jgi:CBS domain-containing protein
MRGSARLVAPLRFDGRVMATIRDVMTSELVTVEPGTTVAEAATIMGAHHVGSALVFGDGGMAGIFTERDILRALASDFDAARHAVEQWMTPHPATIVADAGLREARDMMLERGFRHLPVLDGDDVVGIVSLRDLSRSDS